MTGERRIEALIVDDSSLNIEFLTDRFNIQFDMLDVHVSWTKHQNPQDALHAIREHAFDLVVADIMFPRGDDIPDEEPRLDIVQAARARDRQTYILAITSRNPEHKGTLLPAALLAGATRSVERGAFAEGHGEHSPKAITGEIHAKLIISGRLSTVHIRVSPPREPRIQALIEQVGRPTLTELYRLALDRPDWRSVDHITAAYLAPGASGSAVCRVTARLDGVAERTHVLKLGHNHELLEREIERGRRLAELLEPRLFVPHTTRAPVGPLHNWYAILLPLVTNSENLRDWMRTPQPVATVHNIMSALFTDGLAPMYRNTAEERPATSSLEDLVLPSHRSVRVAASLDKLASAIERVAAETQAEVREMCSNVALFTSRGQFAGRPADTWPLSNWRCVVHGDLHGGNVLVYPGALPSPTIIDSSAVDTGHWAADGAMMHVDLVLTGLADPTDSMFWDQWQHWRTAAAAVSGVGGPDPAPSAALQAAGWLARNLSHWSLPGQSGAAPEQYVWIWHAALACHYARACYRESLALPLRAVAVAAASDQLRLAQQAASGIQ
jgi:CheY-like chemotaxis protein